MGKIADRYKNPYLQEMYGDLKIREYNHVKSEYKIISNNDQYPVLKQQLIVLSGGNVQVPAEGYNRDYRGISVIKSIDYNHRNPIDCDCLSGDDLKYAFLDDHGLETTDQGESYHVTKSCTSFSYSDGYREVFVKKIQ